MCVGSAIRHSRAHLPLLESTLPVYVAVYALCMLVLHAAAGLLPYLLALSAGAVAANLAGERSSEKWAFPICLVPFALGGWVLDALDAAMPYWLALVLGPLAVLVLAGVLYLLTGAVVKAVSGPVEAPSPAPPERRLPRLERVDLVKPFWLWSPTEDKHTWAPEAQAARAAALSYPDNYVIASGALVDPAVPPGHRVEEGADGAVLICERKWGRRVVCESRTKEEHEARVRAEADELRRWDAEYAASEEDFTYEAWALGARDALRRAEGRE